MLDAGVRMFLSYNFEDEVFVERIAGHHSPDATVACVEGA